MAQDWHFHSGELGDIPGWPACAPARTPFHVRALVPRPVRQKENLIMPNEQGFYGPHLALHSSALPLRREARAAPGHQ